jgi:hypothetical protein
MAILDDSKRISRGIELNAIDAGIDQALARLNQYSSQLDTLKADMAAAPYTAADRTDVDNLKAKITAALA